MIGKLTGIVAGHYGNILLIDVCCNNCSVGYEVMMKKNDIEIIEDGKLITLFIKEIIKEDDDSLYGFLSFEDRCWFEELMKISGLGPKNALSILSTYNCKAISDAVMMDNCDFFTAVSGIGSKIANRIPTEMKRRVDKINEKVAGFGFLYEASKNISEERGIATNSNKNNGEQEFFLNDGESLVNKTKNIGKQKSTSSKNDAKTRTNIAMNDAINALSVLGFAKQHIYEDVFKIIKNNPDIATEEIVKEFLKLEKKD